MVVDTSFIAKDARLHVVKVILSTLLKRRVVTFLLKFLRLEVVTGVILITDGDAIVCIIFTPLVATIRICVCGSFVTICIPVIVNTAKGIEWCGMLGRLLGCGRISVLSPEEHDEMIGFVSQLTHCIAVSLMTCSDSTHLADYTGDSFRDLTRIARINDGMWSELFMMNREPLLRQMDTFLKELHNFRDMLERGDTEGMQAKMRLSTERRAMFDKRS